ncbi:MAG: endonuclease III [Planctomycetaceae bacterium]
MSAASWARTVLRRLRKEYPDADCALQHADPFQLAVATVLSAQCTDEMVNRVTPALFGRFPTAEALAGADPEEVERMIHPTGFFRNKTRNILGLARMLVERFAGRMPQTMEELLELPGVARKTANVILGVAFGKAEGVVVDTHVRRLSGRLGFTKLEDPVKIERELMDLLPRKDWIFCGHALILHGRRVCAARAPACDRCLLNDRCPSRL